MAETAGFFLQSLPVMKWTYLWLGITYHALQPSLKNSILVHFSHRISTNAEFASPVPDPVFVALPLSTRSNLPYSSHAADDQLTPFERTIRDLEACVSQLQELTEVEGTVHEGDGSEINKLLGLGHALQVEAEEHLARLGKAVEAHVAISQWLAGRGIFPKSRNEVDIRSEQAAKAWLVRVGEWLALSEVEGGCGGSDCGTESTDAGYVSGGQHSRAASSVST